MYVYWCVGMCRYVYIVCGAEVCRMYVYWCVGMCMYVYIMHGAEVTQRL